MTYGIPYRCIPITADGKIKTKNHLEFIEMRRAQDDYVASKCSDSLSFVLIPSANDVLYGKVRFSID
jgi:hypothetical protein